MKDSTILFIMCILTLGAGLYYNYNTTEVFGYISTHDAIIQMWVFGISLVLFVAGLGARCHEEKREEHTNPKGPNENGFTLFELVYVIGVFSIMAVVGWIIIHFVIKFW